MSSGFRFVDDGMRVIPGDLAKHPSHRLVSTAPASALDGLDSFCAWVLEQSNAASRSGMLRATIILNIKRGTIADGVPLPEGTCELLLKLAGADLDSALAAAEES